ncbi:MAG TPA: glycosyltransferase N-terminal domain-containing protein [Phenylobacterium sp.]
MNEPRSWPLRLYAVMAAAASPLAPAMLSWRARRGKEDPLRLTERLGRPSATRGEGPLVWMHGASVGEGLSLLHLVSQVRALRPDVHVLVTTGTRASAELLADRLPAGVAHQFAPIDTPDATARFISCWRPTLGVFVESELWPNLVGAARASGARMALVSARFSERSWRNWRRSPRAARELLGAFDLIFARDLQARGRIEDLGGRVDGVWDAKLGAAPLAVDSAVLARVRDQVEGLSIVLAASTHPGEEVIVARAFAEAAGEAPNARLVLVPRHPGRGAEVEAVMRAEGLSTGRRSQGADLASARTYVADTMGELGLWYRLALLAVVGGSLVDGVGGHNPLEPARLGRPFVAGPHVDQWPIYSAFVDAGATRILNGQGELADFMDRAINRTPDLADMASRALALARERDTEAEALAPRLLALMDS